MEKAITKQLEEIIRKKPFAQAVFKGSALAPDISGLVQFYPAREGTMVVVDVRGLPEHVPAFLDKPPIGPFGFHIHEGGTCGVQMGENAFESAGAHFNPTNEYHPQHAGDLPAFFSNNGDAFMAVYTNRFKPAAVGGRTAMIHRNPDDFRTQPSGNSGVRIACGVIERVK